MNELVATGGAVLVTEGVRYRYRRTEALRGVDLAIPRAFVLVNDSLRERHPLAASGTSFDSDMLILPRCAIRSRYRTVGAAPG